MPLTLPSFSFIHDFHLNIKYHIAFLYHGRFLATFWVDLTTLNSRACEMEAVGAAAAIAELSGLSLKAGKAAKNLMQAFVHAPAEIAELNSKIERLHLLIQQIDLLCADLPAGDSDLLFPPQHRALISLSLQRTLDSLMSLKSSGQTLDQYGVRGRIRWASMDKRKAQRFLQSIQVAESELDFPLQVLTMYVLR